MYKIGEDEMVICPYNRYHLVRKLRLQKHIVKCKENYPDVKLATCFYNYCHRLKPEAILQHYEVCSHKTRMEGARYDLDFCASTTNSAKVNNKTNAFPDISTKPKFFCNLNIPDSPSSTQMSCKDIHKLNSSDSDTEDFQSNMIRKSRFKCQFPNSYIEDKDDFEPLPLPKTVSKAFVCVKQNSKLFPDKSETSQHKVFGRGKNLFAPLSEKPLRSTDQLIPELRRVHIDLPKNKENPNIFLKNGPDSCTESIESSMIDDTSTLKSERILFDNDISSDDDNHIIFKNLDIYTKI